MENHPPLGLVNWPCRPVKFVLYFGQPRRTKDGRSKQSPAVELSYPWPVCHRRGVATGAQGPPYYSGDHQPVSLGDPAILRLPVTAMTRLGDRWFDDGCGGGSITRHGLYRDCNTKAAEERFAFLSRFNTRAPDNWGSDLPHVWPFLHNSVLVKGL